MLHLQSIQVTYRGHTAFNLAEHRLTVCSKLVFILNEMSLSISRKI